MRLSLLTLLCLAAPARAGLIDFESAVWDIPYSGVATVTEFGVTFSALENGLINTQSTPIWNSRGLRSAEINPPSRMPLLRADFESPVTNVSVMMGDGGGVDADLLRIDAYDIAGQLLGEDRYQVAAEVGGLFQVGVEASGISYVIFGADTAPTPLRPEGTSSVVADYFAWGGDFGAVPEPSSLALAAVAIVGLAYFRRSRQKR